jgi:hypothetical protein
LFGSYCERPFVHCRSVRSLRVGWRTGALNAHTRQLTRSSARTLTLYSLSRARSLSFPHSPTLSLTHYSYTHT